jgi:hypothetical protein
MERHHMLARLPVSDWLAWSALALAAIAAAAGLFIPHLYRDTEAWVRQAQASDLTTLALAVPSLGIGLWTARRGSRLGRLVAVGALAFLAYGYAIFAFAVETNPMTLLHYAILGLATWSIGLNLAGSGVPAGTGSAMPRRTTGIFLLVTAVLFALLWLGQIAGSIASGEPAPELVRLGLRANPVWALDLAFALPAFAVVGIGLLRGGDWAASAAVATLTFTVVMGASILAIFGLDGMAGAAVELMPVVLIGGIVLSALGLLFAGIGGDRKRPMVPSHR